MPHDRNGNELAVGDRVLIPATVRVVYPGEGACNVEVEVDESPAAENEYRPHVSMNAGFVLRAVSESGAQG